MHGQLAGKTTIVTGGAGLLGRALCRAISEAGGAVVVADLDEARALHVASAIRSENPNAAVMHGMVDITSERSVNDLIAAAREKFVRVDGLVNCAYPHNPRYGHKLEDVTYGDFVENVGLHLGGYFLASKLFALHCRKLQHEAVVVNIASIYGVVAPRFEIYDGTQMTMPVEYAAIKAGLIHLTRYFAKYFRNTGIRFVSLSPGGMKEAEPRNFSRSTAPSE